MMAAEAGGGLGAGGVTPLLTGFNLITPLLTGFNLNFTCFNVKCNYRF